MPYRAKRRSLKRRRRSKKPVMRLPSRFNAGSAKTKLVTVPRGKLAFPNKMRASLRYCDSINLDLTSIASDMGGQGVTNDIVSHSFRVNGCFDPDMAVGGHQPRGFDEYMNIYERFTVVSSKLTVQFMYEGYAGPATQDITGGLVQSVKTSNVTPSVDPIVVGTHLGVDAMEAGSASNAMEQGTTTWAYLIPNTPVRRLSRKFGAAKHFGSGFGIGDF